MNKLMADHRVAFDEQRDTYMKQMKDMRLAFEEERSALEANALKLKAEQEKHVENLKASHRENMKGLEQELEMAGLSTEEKLEARSQHFHTLLVDQKKASALLLEKEKVFLVDSRSCVARMTCDGRSSLMVSLLFVGPHAQRSY